MAGGRSAGRVGPVGVMVLVIVAVSGIAGGHAEPALPALLTAPGWAEPSGLRLDEADRHHHGVPLAVALSCVTWLATGSGMRSLHFWQPVPLQWFTLAASTRVGIWRTESNPLRYVVGIGRWVPKLRVAGAAAAHRPIPRRLRLRPKTARPSRTADPASDCYAEYANR